MSARRLVPFAVLLALVVSVALLPAAGAATGGPGATASKKCPKGKKLVVVKKNGKVVRKNGKPVKKCVKKTTKPACRAASASCVVPPPPPPAETKLFEAPGRVLEGNDAKPFIEKYLLNSTFTDCVKGWPECVGGQENRYSHAKDFTFYKCFLRPTSGSDVKSVGEYGLDGAKIEAAGDWYFREVIAWYGEYDVYEWHVLQNGVVEGANQPNPPNGPSEKLAPLTYIGGVAKTCSY